MYLIKRTKQFDQWLKKLKDIKGKAKILTRLKKIENGELGDHKQITPNLWELRFKFSPGYRIYYHLDNSIIVIIINAGNKDTQSRDIEKAKKILKSLENEI
jgi:putative addiction module killer protein